jgi:hypothetical protein
MVSCPYTTMKVEEKCIRGHERKEKRSSHFVVITPERDPEYFVMSL